MACEIDISAGEGNHAESVQDSHWNLGGSDLVCLCRATIQCNLALVYDDCVCASNSCAGVTSTYAIIINERHITLDGSSG